MWIRLVNIGRRPVTVGSVGWKLSRFAGFELYQKVEVGRGATLPARLADGDEASIFIPVVLPGRRNWYEDLAKVFLRFGRVRRILELRTFRFCAHCKTGEVYCVRPSKDFMQHLHQAVSKLLEEEQGRGLVTPHAKEG